MRIVASLQSYLSSDAISTHQRVGGSYRPEFNPAGTCKDDRNDVSTICQAVDLVTSQSDNAGLGGLELDAAFSQNY